jgi:TolB protein
MPWLQHQPAWSPDGQALYFVSGRGRQTHDIWRYGFPDGRLEQLTSGQLYHFDVTVSPKGELAYSSNRSGNYEIWVQGGGEEPARLTHHPALDAGPTWSPDGSTLLFESSRGGVPNIWKMTPGGSPPVQVTRHEGGARAPVWRHDAGGGR